MRRASERCLGWICTCAVPICGVPLNVVLDGSVQWGTYPGVSALEVFAACEAAE